MNVILKEQIHDELFYNDSFKDFSKKMLKTKHVFYNKQINEGKIQIVSYKAVNAYIDKLCAKYPNITFVAYNVSFDVRVLALSGVTIPAKTFCLWYASSIFFKRKGYINFCIKGLHFSPRCIMLTSCEVLMKYLNINEKHRHFASFDVNDEIQVLAYLLRQKQVISVCAYDWKKYALPTVLQRAGYIIA